MGMWLPRDERRLLAGIYRNLDTVDTTLVCRELDLGNLLARRKPRARIPRYGQSPSHPSGPFNSDNFPQFRDRVKNGVFVLARIQTASKLLKARGLVEIQQHHNEQGVIIVSMTVDGVDLGRRYQSWWDSSGLWFAHYKDHWVWLLIAAIGGGAISKMIEFVASRLP